MQVRYLRLSTVFTHQYGILWITTVYILLHTLFTHWYGISIKYGIDEIVRCCCILKYMLQVQDIKWRSLDVARLCHRLPHWYVCRWCSLFGEVRLKHLGAMRPAPATPLRSRRYSRLLGTFGALAPPDTSRQLSRQTYWSATQARPFRPQPDCISDIGITGRAAFAAWVWFDALSSARHICPAP